MMSDVTQHNPDMLRYVREDAQLSVQDMAARLQVHPDTIRAWESGVPIPQPMMKRWAAETRRSINVFFLVKRPDFVHVPETIADLEKCLREWPPETSLEWLCNEQKAWRVVVSAQPRHRAERIVIDVMTAPPPEVTHDDRPCRYA